MPADGKKRKNQNSVPDLAADSKKKKKKEITVDATGEELRMKTERELRAERREKAREYTQVGVRIENEKIDLPMPSDGKKRRENQISVPDLAAGRKKAPGEELRLRMKTERELRAERREREKRELERLVNNKTDLPDPDVLDREEEEEDGIPVDAPVYTGEELDEVKDYFPKFDGVLPPWETRHGAGMDDKKQWPPIWKQNFLKSPEYQAFRDFLRYGRSDSTYRLICKEIRNSRGYDITHVDEYIPEEFHEMFLVEKCIAVGACKYVTDQINERAKDHGESYVFDEVKKAVRWRFPRAHYWYTFTVKQERPTSGNIKTVQAFVYCRSLHKVVVFLKEWRFKP